MVPAGARQIDGIAGSAGTASRAQAAAGTAYRCGIKHPGNTARLWPEGWCGDAQGVRGADSGVGDGPGHIGAHRRGSARAALKAEYEKLHKAVLAIVREDPVCRRLMTVPSVGPLVAITYKSAMDDPSRIAKSKAAGALFGLTPKKYQSGEKDVTGGITRTGDERVRTALYEAANVLLSRITRFSKLNRWGMDVAKRRGSKRAKVALARKIAVILHRIWIDGTTYRWAEAKPIAVQG